MLTAQEQLKETYHDVCVRFNHLNDKQKYYMAVNEFEEKYSLKCPYSSYESFKAATSRKHNGK